MREKQVNGDYWERQRGKKKKESENEGEKEREREREARRKMHSKQGLTIWELKVKEGNGIKSDCSAKP